MTPIKYFINNFIVNLFYKRAATPEDHADAKATLPKNTGGAITASALANRAPPINAPAAPVASAAKILPPLLIFSV